MNDDLEWQDWSRRWHGMPIPADNLEDRTAIPQRPRKLLSVVLIVLLLAGATSEIFLEHSIEWAIVWLVATVAWVTTRLLAWKAVATAGEVTAVYANTITSWNRAGMVLSVFAVTASLAIAARWIDHLSRGTRGGASSLGEGGLLLAVSICSMVLFSRQMLGSVRVLRFLRQEAKAGTCETGWRAIWSARPGGFRLAGKRRRSNRNGAV